MIKQERVIDALKCCSIDNYNCEDCPYWGIAICEKLLKENALALLKAQEQEIKGLKQEIEGHKEDLQETLGVMMNYAEQLKAQEPKLVVNIHKANNNVLNPNVPWVGKCPKCGRKIDGKNLTRFCKYCGQAVKWE